jgi:phage portal protein BeeE
VNLLDRMRAKRDQTINLETLDSMFKYQGLWYQGFQTTLAGSNQQDIDNNFEGYVAGIANKNGTVAGAVFARSLLLSQMVFRYRRLADGIDGQLFGNQSLLPLERFDAPFTRERVLMRAEAHVSYAGNAYFYLPPGGRMRLLNPDRVSLLLASDADPDSPTWQLDAELVGYLYTPNKNRSGQVFIPPEDVVQWAPEPHPVNPWIGQSWITSVMREVLGDEQLTEHQSKFYSNAATPNMVITLPSGVDQAGVDQFMARHKAANVGPSKAGKTMLVTDGADVKVVGSQLAQLEIKDTQGGHESRIAARSRVPATVLGIREGLAGSALNAGNYSSARRMWADGWVSPTFSGLCSTLSPLIDVPEDAELVHDPSRVMFLQEDRKDEADIAASRAQTIKTYVEAGFSAESAVDAVRTGDVSRLKHTGLLSVQLQEPGTTPPQEAA